ncbi:hypothetical protein [Radiobacillus sp. PE A8.2]|uniref:hypothetical protein n=1 Tax=Radiobacillus sp. PE A8.2 TaxID=3380349 RepID=UPI00388E3B3D
MLVIAPIGIIVHEFGHALGAVFVNADEVTLHIGSGNAFKSIKLLKINVVFHKYILFGGRALSTRTVEFTKLERIVITLAGPILNIFVVVVLYVFKQDFTSFFIELLLLFNGWMALFNLVPFKRNGQMSDGYQIIHILRSK